MNLILKTLNLFKALQEVEPENAVPLLPTEGGGKETVKLGPMAKKQLNQAIKEAESQCIVSVFNHDDDMIVEHRLVPSEGSSEVFAELCRKYTGIEDDDVERAKEDGFYATGFYQISAIHLDSNGQYDQSPGEE